MSRLDSARIASIKAQHASLSLVGTVVASDAFFPFRDGLDVVVDAGASCVIQPGGSMRDQEVIDAANGAAWPWCFRACAISATEPLRQTTKSGRSGRFFNKNAGPGRSLAPVVFLLARICVISSSLACHSSLTQACTGARRRFTARLARPGVECCAGGRAPPPRECGRTGRR